MIFACVKIGRAAVAEDVRDVGGSYQRRQIRWNYVGDRTVAAAKDVALLHAVVKGDLAAVESGDPLRNGNGVQRLLKQNFKHFPKSVLR